MLQPKRKSLQRSSSEMNIQKPSPGECSFASTRHAQETWWRPAMRARRSLFPGMLESRSPHTSNCWVAVRAAGHYLAAVGRPTWQKGAAEKVCHEMIQINEHVRPVLLFNNKTVFYALFDDHNERKYCRSSRIKGKYLFIIQKPLFCSMIPTFPM